MTTYNTTAKWLLRKLVGSNVISDIDAGFDALAEDVDSKLTPWSAGTWDTRPAATKAGQRYFVTDWGMEIVADGTNWQLAGNVGIGDFVETMRVADPPGGFLLLCDGRSILRASVPAYSAIIGGSSTNINLPDLRGRGTVSPSAMGGPNQTGNDRVQVAAAAVVGEVAHTLSVTEIPSHNHSGATGGPSAIDHTHGFQAVALSGGSGTEALQQPGGVNRSTAVASGGGLATHTHTIGSQGGGSGHNTVHPVVGVNKLVRVK